MSIELSPELVNKHFKEQKDELTAELTKKEKKELDEAKITYIVKYAQRVKSLRLDQIMQQRRPEPKPEFDESSYCIEDIQAKYGRKSSTRSITDVQKKIVLDLINAQWQERMDEEEKEKNRFASLTPDQKAQEQEEMLAQLRGYSGFMEIKIPKN